MNITAEIWSQERLDRLKVPRTHTTADRQPVWALYLFASSSKPFIRAGAIGVNRAYDLGGGVYGEEGNSITGRFKQHNTEPDTNLLKRGADKGKSKLDLLPWCAKPYQYIWGVTLDGEISPSVVSVAEHMMHQRLFRSGFRYGGRSCFECNDLYRAIEVANQSLKVFLRLASELFSADSP